MSNQPSGFFSVLLALLGNTTVTIIKFIAASVSGSSAMFSEAIHSLADTSNQALLMIGLKRSLKKPSDDFIYGYGRERFFWALISACGIFFVGAGVTVYKGIVALNQHNEIIFHPLVFVVLLISFVIELTTFFVAARELKRRYPEYNYWQRLKYGDPSTLAVYFEDGLAVIGVLIAAISLILARLTGNHLWDAWGSIIIGIFLGIVAIILMLKNRGYLIGCAIPDDLQEKIIATLEADPAIEKVLDFKSTILDIGVFRIKCEIEFNGNALLDELLKNASLREQFDEIGDDYEKFKKTIVNYLDRVPRLMGKKIDEIEKKLKQENPGVKYIDIEIN